MKVLGFGIPSWNLIYFPLIPICGIVAGALSALLLPNLASISSILLIFLMLLTDLLLGLPYIYVLLRRAVTRKPSFAQRYPIVLPHQSFNVVQNEKKYEKIRSIISLISISLIKTTVLFVFAYTNLSYSMWTHPSKENGKFFSTLVNSLLPVTFASINVINFFIFNLPLHKHQKYSLIIIAIGLTFQLFPHIQHEKSIEIQIPLYCLVYILNGIQYVAEKWLMNKKYYTVFGLLFYEGIIGLCTTVVIGYILEELLSEENAIVFGGSKRLWIELKGCFQTESILYFLGVIVMYGGNSFSMMQIKYHYTPMHCGIAIFLNGFSSWIVFIVNQSTFTEYVWIVAIGHAFGLIGILIYTEMIIVYVFGFHTNTTKEINRRSQHEFSQSTNDDCLVGELQYIQVPNENI